MCLDMVHQLKNSVTKLPMFSVRSTC